jgi:hypothetical protein
MKSGKQLQSLRLGCAGEYMVAAMMNLQEWDAALTQKNYPSVDIFGHNSNLNKDARIQVKTASSKQTSFLIGFSHDKLQNMYSDVEGPYVFVHFKSGTTPDYYIIDKASFISLVLADDAAYFSRPRTRPISTDYPVAISVKALKPYKDQWDNLWK